jgi:hypothetical protein
VVGDDPGFFQFSGHGSCDKWFNVS